MKLKLTIALTLSLTISTYAIAQKSQETFDQKAQKLLSTHVQQYKDLEYFSGASLSIYIPKDKIHNFYAGTVSHDANSPKVGADTLFQIGSITKSFTAAILLQLDKEKILRMEDTIKNYLPEYPKWSAIHITELLNMTSGLPNYSDTPLLNTEIYKNLSHYWANKELIKYVYPSENLTPPLKKNYFYTNTGYILADMIIEKITKKSFKDELLTRTFVPAELTNTFYPIPEFDKTVSSRMAHGYYYNQYDNPFLVGADVSHNNLSWAGAAGAIVSTSEDVIKWVKALFIDNKILDNAQKHLLMKSVSLSTGKPITKVSAQDPHSFGLGVAEMYNDKHPLENMWFYEGETLGFRALYIYVPCNGVIISTIFNSSTNSENDHAKDLVKAAYQLVIDNNPQLRCHK